MKLTLTLSRYIAAAYAKNMVFLLGILLGIIFLFDMVELLRRAGGSDDVHFSVLFQMGLLKLPEVGQRLIPFAILFSAMFTFWQLSKRYELIVMRSAGFSVWQFLAPVIVVAVAVAILQVMLFNPVGAAMLGKFKQMEVDYIKSSVTSQIAFFDEGLWLRQDMENSGEYAVFHASGMEQSDWSLQNVMFLQFDENNNFLFRMDSPSARLEPGNWVFSDVTVHEAGESSGRKEQQIIIPTALTIEEIEDSFSSIDTMSFWSLPRYIATLEATGFDASRLKVHYQSLWAQPFMLAAMVLLAATVSLRPPRQRGAFMIIAIGVFIGFIVFFLSSFLQALGASNQIPTPLAAWSPSLICLLLGVSALMNLEDG